MTFPTVADLSIFIMRRIFTLYFGWHCCCLQNGHIGIKIGGDADKLDLSRDESIDIIDE